MLLQQAQGGLPLELVEAQGQLELDQALEMVQA